MEQQELIVQCIWLIDQASICQGEKRPRAARVHLSELQDLLAEELVGETPAEPEPPERDALQEEADGLTKDLDDLVGIG